jgi:thymidylate synthase ThyX
METEEAFRGFSTWEEVLEHSSKMTNELYHQALIQLTPILGRKRAKESARYFKTMNSQITLSVMMNMSCFHNFYTLRNDSAAQKEIQWIAEEMLNCIKNIPDNPFKYTIKAFQL